MWLWKKGPVSADSTTGGLLNSSNSLWGVKDTAPYFHDNGAKTLRDAVAHYQRFFNFTEAEDPVGSRSLGGLLELTDSDVDDIVAYLKLLGPNRIDR